MGVQNHLGIANRTRGEIDQAGVIAARFGAIILGGRLIDDFVEVRPAFAVSEISVGFNQYCVLDSRTFLAHLVEFGRSFTVGDKALCLRHLGTELDIFRGQQGGARNGNSSQFH